jgi:hypothetical protein
MQPALLLAAATVLGQVWATEVKVTPTPTPDPHAEVPSPVVERVFNEGSRSSRLSLFDNGVAVVAVRDGEREELFRKVLLDALELAAYRAAVERDVGQVRSSDQPALEGLSARGVIRIWSPEGEMREVEYAPGVMLDLPTSRLVATLDDLQKRVAEASPFEDQVRRWQPQRGDVVELFGGQLAEVRDVDPDEGMIWVAYRDSAMIEMIPASARLERVLRVVSD